MKIAFTIGAYRLADFIQLGIKQLQKLSPESPILISDDPGPESDHIRVLAAKSNVQYMGARARRGHFAADFQSMVNALAFAQATGSDVAVKISQRFVLRKPEAIDVIQKVFSDPNIMMATPGKPTTIRGGRAQQAFGGFGILTDIVMFRTGAITPEELLVAYRARIIREQVPWKDFIECSIDELHSNQFNGRSMKVPEFTNPTPDPIYLRRYQAGPEQYRELAMQHGFNGQFKLEEWNSLEGARYQCRPVVV